MARQYSFSTASGNGQKSTLHLYRVPNRTKSIRNEHVGRTRDTDSRMDGPSWGVVLLVLLVYGRTAA
jgi:hypothetical protein